MTGNIKLMKLLMLYPNLLSSRPKCDVKARDADGKTAAEIAREKGFHEFAKYLKSGG